MTNEPKKTVVFSLSKYEIVYLEKNRHGEK